MQQLTIFARGGQRDGAGRKPRGERALVPHERRARIMRPGPMHVTTRLVEGLPSMRTPEAFAQILAAFRAGQDRFGFRLVHFSVQSSHLHLLVEVDDESVLKRGMKGLLVRIARALGRLWNRRGSLIADRYHARRLGSPGEVRRAFVYVLQNARKHDDLAPSVDPFSSARWFGGWEAPPGVDPGGWDERAVVSARLWLTSVGWRVHGEIDLLERPAPERARGKSRRWRSTRQVRVGGGSSARQSG